MRKTMLSLALLTAFASSALAAHLHAASTALTTQPATSIAKHGADDGPGDDRGNDGPGHTSPLAKHGADDGPGDDRGDDGPGHTSPLAKHGADDGPGDDRGNDGPGHMSGLA